MGSDYTPSTTPYRVPDDTDAPDVPADIRSYAARMPSFGARTRWNGQVSTEGEPASVGGLVPGTLAAGFSGTVAAAAAPVEYSTFAPRAIAFVYGQAIVGNFANCAGYVGVTNSIAGGSWISRYRWATNGSGDALWTLSAFGVYYYQPGNWSGASLYMTVDAAGSSLLVQEAQVNIRSYPVNF